MTNKFDRIQENANKPYVVRNCPYFEDEGTFYNCVNEHIEGDCQDCTNCVLKQIVDECKRGINYSQCNCGAVGNLINILNILDIQEVE